jgi:hypothetical protein
MYARIRNLLRFRSGRAQLIHRGFRHNNLHDGFAPAGTGNAASFYIRITAATNERRISHAPRPFAARAASGRARDHLPALVYGHRADRAALMNVIRIRVRTCMTMLPSRKFARYDQRSRIAQCHSLFRGEPFRPFANQHHVLAEFHYAARQSNGILYTLKHRDRARLQRGAVHQDGIELDAAVEV